MNRNQSVIIGLSGGVDSAVAALLLQRAGYRVVGTFMKNWSTDDFGGPCPWTEDLTSARAVARRLRIPLKVWNFEREYRRRVFEVMLKEYRRGRTPNPDILCNREIKFSLFLKRAVSQADFVATGHYARTKNGRLYKAVDRRKDQSYFLAAVTGAALKQTIFPLGNWRKTAVRELAKKAKLPNWDRPDSTGICFIGEQNMTEFLKRHLALKPGPIIVPDGQPVGEHHGLPLYTIGQRHGFGRQLNQAALAKRFKPGQAFYVVNKRLRDNALVIAPADKTAQLAVTEFVVESPQWINKPPAWPWAGRAKLRYRQPDIKVVLDRAGADLKVRCLTPQRAVTPGQYAVFYKNDECLGAAVIRRVIF